MREYRIALIAVLVVLGGSVLAVGISGCQKSSGGAAQPSTLSADAAGAPATPPKRLMLPHSVQQGDVLVWDPPDPSLGTLILAIPDTLCAPSEGKDYSNKHYWVVTVGTDPITCRIGPQRANLPFFYKYQFVPPQGGMQPPAAAAAAIPKIVPPPPQTGRTRPGAASYSGPVQLLNIVGSCEGCGDGGKHAVRMFQAKPLSGVTAQVECNSEGTPDTPEVVDGDDIEQITISVPAQKNHVAWIPQGDTLTVDFSGNPPPAPCAEIQNSVLQGNQCTINTGARGKSYYYTVALSQCNGNQPSKPKRYTLKLEATLPQK
jgi:hypothetical protein